MVRVSKAKNSDLKLWREGATLVTQSGSSIEDLLLLAAAARWQFATSLRREGMRALRVKPPMYRVAVGRFYYAMYHALRAVLFVEYDGDDFEEHRTLPTKAVNVIPAASQWQNRLKNARGISQSSRLRSLPEVGSRVAPNSPGSSA